jgi:hypothetical protein
MSSNPNRQQHRSEYRTPTTNQPETPDDGRTSTEETAAAPSMFAPVERPTMPEMFETAAEYEDR